MLLPTPTLQSARLLLRPFAQTDAEALYALQSNARVLRDWDSPPWSERSRAAAFNASLTPNALASATPPQPSFIGLPPHVVLHPSFRNDRQLASRGQSL
jgi:RimJ/RimL family protein N-acetyltransferase